MTHEEMNLNSPDKRRTFWIVLVLNALLAAGFLITGVIADSNAMVPDTLAAPRFHARERVKASKLRA